MHVGRVGRAHLDLPVRIVREIANIEIDPYPKRVLSSAVWADRRYPAPIAEDLQPLAKWNMDPHHSRVKLLLRRDLFYLGLHFIRASKALARWSEVGGAGTRKWMVAPTTVSVAST